MVVCRRDKRRWQPCGVGDRLYRFGVFAVVSLVGAARSGQSLLHQCGHLRPRRAVYDDRQGAFSAAPDSITAGGWPLDDALGGRRVDHRHRRDFRPSPHQPRQGADPRHTLGDHRRGTAAHTGWRAYLATVCPDIDNQRRAEQPRLAMAGTWLFRRQFRHPRAGG